MVELAAAALEFAEAQGQQLLFRLAESQNYRDLHLSEVECLIEVSSIFPLSRSHELWSI